MSKDRDTLPAPIPRFDPSSDDFSVLRETFLEAVTEPALNAALRVVAQAQYAAFSEYAYAWPAREPFLCRRFQAALADLRQVQGVLQEIPKWCKGELGWEIFVPLAERASRTLDKLADDVERGIEAFQASVQGQDATQPDE
jgi:hypothetical protein